MKPYKGLTMHTIDHAAILNAYLSRLTRADLQNILESKNAWTSATLNGNANAQLSAQSGFYGAVANAVNNLIEHDVELIERKLRALKPNI